MVESLNNMLVNAREFSYVALLDVIRENTFKWWNERRTLARQNERHALAIGYTSPFTPNWETKFRSRFVESSSQMTLQLNLVTYHVKEGDLDTVVDIYNKTCTCKQFNMTGYRVDTLQQLHIMLVQLCILLSRLTTQKSTIRLPMERLYISSDRNHNGIYPRKLTHRQLFRMKLRRREEGQKVRYFPMPENT